MEQKLHTPEGVRDVYNSECKKKLALQEKLLKNLHEYGYQDIQTPTFEYIEVFRKEIGTTSIRELYKFFDRDGSTLALRPDITPSVARAAATLFEHEELPVRLCYVGNTFINHTSYQGRLKESTQLGAELIGDDSIDADAEMIAMVVDGLKQIGLQEFQVNIGHVDFTQSLLDATKLDENVLGEIRDLIGNRNYFGVEEILLRHEVDSDVIHAFTQLPELNGSYEILGKAASLAPSNKAKIAIVRLLKIYSLLIQYGVEEHVNFDLSMRGSYGYYSGIIFRAYTYGTGDAIVRGGRYDHLLGKFGKNTPSIGFGIYVDHMMSAFRRQKIDIDISHTNTIIYTKETRQWAISLAKDFRSKGKCIQLLKRKSDEEKESFVDYCKRNECSRMLYLHDDHTITMIDPITGEESTTEE